MRHNQRPLRSISRTDDLSPNAFTTLRLWLCHRIRHLTQTWKHFLHQVKNGSVRFFFFHAQAYVRRKIYWLEFSSIRYCDLFSFFVGFGEPTNHIWENVHWEDRKHGVPFASIFIFSHFFSSSVRLLGRSGHQAHNTHTHIAANNKRSFSGGLIEYFGQRTLYHLPWKWPNAQLSCAHVSCLLMVFNMNYMLLRRHHHRLTLSLVPYGWTRTVHKM